MKYVISMHSLQPVVGEKYAVLLIKVSDQPFETMTIYVDKVDMDRNFQLGHIIEFCSM